MIYQNERAIYVKIADRLCDDILSGKYKEEERVPSIRELAAEYEVNTNTVLRTFDILQRDEIIYQKRGIGVFVSHGALRRIRSARKKAFLQNEMPEFFRRLRLLDLSIEDVVQAWDTSLKDLKSLGESAKEE